MDIKKFGIVGLLIALVVMSCVPAFALEVDQAVSVELDETGQEVDLMGETEQAIAVEVIDDSPVDLTEIAEVEINGEIIEIAEDNPHPQKAYFVNTLTLKLINFFMDKFGLEEDDSISSLIDALVDDNEELKEEKMAELGAETEQEFHELLRIMKADKLRELFDLDASYTDEEVFEYAEEAKIEEIKELLGLDEDASQEEVNAALEDWREENKLLIGLGKFKFWKGFF